MKRLDATHFVICYECEINGYDFYSPLLDIKFIQIISSMKYLYGFYPKAIWKMKSKITWQKNEFKPYFERESKPMEEKDVVFPLAKFTLNDLHRII